MVWALFSLQSVPVSSARMTDAFTGVNFLSHFFTRRDLS